MEPITYLAVKVSQLPEGSVYAEQEYVCTMHRDQGDEYFLKLQGYQISDREPLIKYVHLPVNRNNALQMLELFHNIIGVETHTLGIPGRGPAAMITGSKIVLDDIQPPTRPDMTIRGTDGNIIN